MKKKNMIITAAAVAVVAALVLPRFLKPKDSVNSAAAPVVSAEQPQIGTIEIYTDLSGALSRRRWLLLFRRPEERSQRSM